VKLKKQLQCKSIPAQSQIWHTMWQSCLKWRTISHMWSIFCFACVKYASPFFWHMVCQIRLKWSQQRRIVKHILHNMCQMWLCAGARFTVIWCALCTPHRGIKIIVQSGLLFVIFCYIKQFSLDTWSTSWLLFEYEDIVQNRLASGANNVSPLYIGPCIIMIFLGCMYEYVRRKVGIYCRVKIACGKRIITHYENSKAHPTGVFLWICLNDISLGRSSASLAGLILLGINIDISYLDWA
jgi:hypothetical protein